MAQVCPQCSTANADGALFCHACGTPIARHSVQLTENDAPDARRCEDCGHHNPAAASYCERCGYGLAALFSLGDMPEPAAPAPLPPPPPAPPPAPSWRRSRVPDEDTFDPLSAPTLVMSHTAPAPLQPMAEGAVAASASRKAIKLVLAVAAVVAVAALAVWLLGRAPQSAAPPAPLPASAAVQATPASSPAPASASAPLASAVASATASTPPPAAPAAVSAPVSMAPSSTATAGTAPVAPPEPAPERRLRKPEPVSRKRALEAMPQRTEAVLPPPAQPAPPVPVPAAPAPVRAKTVADICAGSNLLMRGFCELRECRKAESSADPSCVKLKEAEQRRLFQQ